MSLLWAARGRSWGFRFLLDGGFADPLREYDKAFSAVGDEPEVCRRVGETVALRFPDPMQRKDRAGRVIPHEFVVSGPLVDQINSVEDGVQLVWKQREISDRFAEIWDQPKPPSPNS